MQLEPPVLNVLVYGVVAALAAALGVVPSAFGAAPRATIAAAYALAGGLMVGAGYLLMAQALEVATLAVVAGSAIGVAYTWWVSWVAGLEALEPAETDGNAGPPTGKLVLQATLHSAAEGVAIGAGMAWSLRLGVFLALALAIHNVGEAMALTDVVRRRGLDLRRAAGLAVLTNVPQPLLGVFAFALAPALPAFFPAVLGFAAGALVYLVLTELAPAAYRLARAGLVALLLTAATGAVILVESLVV